MSLFSQFNILTLCCHATLKISPGLSTFRGYKKKNRINQAKTVQSSKVQSSRRFPAWASKQKGSPPFRVLGQTRPDMWRYETCQKALSRSKSLSVFLQTQWRWNEARLEESSQQLARRVRSQSEGRQLVCDTSRAYSSSSNFPGNNLQFFHNQRYQTCISFAHFVALKWPQWVEFSSSGKYHLKSMFFFRCFFLVCPISIVKCILFSNKNAITRRWLLEMNSVTARGERKLCAVRKKRGTVNTDKEQWRQRQGRGERCGGGLGTLEVALLLLVGSFMEPETYTVTSCAGSELDEWLVLLVVWERRNLHAHPMSKTS